MEVGTCKECRYDCATCSNDNECQTCTVDRNLNPPYCEYNYIIYLFYYSDVSQDIMMIVNSVTNARLLVLLVQIIISAKLVLIIE